MEDPASQSEDISWKRWWVAHPMVGFIGSVASVLAIPLAIYLYLSGGPLRELIISSDPPVAIVRGGQASSVDILYHGNKITTDVYARQVYVWNAGNDSIRDNNILEPIGIVIPRATILETRVRRVRRQLSNIIATIDGGNTVSLSWTILEHNDGAAIDIIYASPDASKLSVMGTVEHQPTILVREYESARKLVLTNLAGIISFKGNEKRWLLKM